MPAKSATPAACCRRIPKFWTEPGGEFVRLVGKDVSGAQLQANRAAKKLGLLTAEEPLIVMRVDLVAEAVTNQYWALIKRGALSADRLGDPDRTCRGDHQVARTAGPKFG